MLQHGFPFTRVFSKTGLASLVIMALVISGVAFASEHASSITADEAMTMLKDGNARYASGKSAHPRQAQARRTQTAQEGQHPYATVLSCSDSRAPVETVFDAGVGDIFTVRVAGNISDVDEIASVEYAVSHLGTPLVLVLGHTKCGAVTAAVQGAKDEGYIPDLLENIAPAAQKAKAENPMMKGDALVDQAVKTNMWQSIEDMLSGSRTVRDRVLSGKLKVVGGIYNLETGAVEFLGVHPKQADILAASK